MDYDIGEAFRRIEEELIASMMRNLDHHRAMESDEGIKWSQWQVEQLAALDEYRRNNRVKFSRQFQDANSAIDTLIRQARQQGGMDQEIRILDAIRKGYSAHRITHGGEAGFFRVNDKKLDALIEATTNDMKAAEHAVLRRANDQYRQIIFKSQAYANAGGTTYEKAVDMATQDFLRAGIQCVEYKNGARHTLSDYADMAIKTATKRAYLTGEGEKRQEWGIATVIMNKRGNPCPLCAPYCGKVMIDDVWSGGKSDGKHPLMSKAIEHGLYHPRCKDSHTTYFPGISTAPDPYDDDELEQAVEDYNDEQEIARCDKQAERYRRLENYSLDENNKRVYREKANRFEDIRDSKSFNLKDIGRSLIGKAKTKWDVVTGHNPPISIMDLDAPYLADILDVISNAPDNARNILLRFENDIKILNEKAIGNTHYSPRKKAIIFNLKKDQRGNRGRFVGLFHEIGHSVDDLLGRPSQSSMFKKALVDDFDSVVKQYMKVYNKTKDEAYEEISSLITGVENHSISDLCSAISKGKCVGRYGHDEAYWNKPHKLEREAFAHFFEALSRNDVKKLTRLKEMFPTAFDLFEQMLL